MLAEITVSPYRGLFYSAPWLALAVPGAVAWWRRGRRAEVAVAGSIILLFVWLNASLVDWQGGWAMGARYLVPSRGWCRGPVAPSSTLLAHYASISVNRTLRASSVGMTHG